MNTPRELKDEKKNQIQYNSEDIIKMIHQLYKVEQSKAVEAKFSVFQELSQNEISTVSMIANDPDIMVKDICIRLNLPKSTMTHMINRLEQKGYLLREVAPKDLRSFRLLLTEKGQQAQQQHIDYEKYLVDHMENALDKQEIGQLGEMLYKYISEMNYN